MPICEADPWRLQYFSGVSCPPDVRVPTEDADAWLWNPAYACVYNKLAVALSQGLEAAPHGVVPKSFPVFSKPIINLRGMGIESRVIATRQEYDQASTPGHFWMPLLQGEHVSSDVALIDGQPVWWRHTTGKPGPGGTFDYWTVHALKKPALEAAGAAWAEKHLAGYSGMANLETIGGRIIEVHLRFADQWPDLYGAGWVAAVVQLYAEKEWNFADTDRRDGYSVVLFVPHGMTYRHPPAAIVDSLLSEEKISSVQITFHEGRSPTSHAMPPGGFRVAIINGFDLSAALAAREVLRRAIVSG